MWWENIISMTLLKYFFAFRDTFCPGRSETNLSFPGTSQGTVKGMFSHLYMSELTVMLIIVILFVDLPAGFVVFVVHLFSST